MSGPGKYVALWWGTGNETIYIPASNAINKKIFCYQLEIGRLFANVSTEYFSEPFFIYAKAS